MTIEFRCSQCGQLLRVPEDAAGKSARCPRCQALMNVPGVATAVPSTGEPQSAGLAPASAPIDSASPSAPSPPPFGSSPTTPTSVNPPATSFPPPPPKPPSDSPFASGASPAVNPYASPAATGPFITHVAVPSLPINPQHVGADTVFNYAWQIWKENLGLLVGVTITVFGITLAIALPFGAIQYALQQQGETDAVRAVDGLGRLLVRIAQMYLGIGATQINLKLARRQPAAYGELFGGIGLFLPVLGGTIIAGLGIILGILCLIVPALLMVLAFWPFYYLIVDRKAGVIESFSVASRITNGNWGTYFLLCLVGVGIISLVCVTL